MLMYNDCRSIKYYNNDITQITVAVGKDGVTKIEVYKECVGEGYIPYLAIWKGTTLTMRTPAIGKEIVYEENPKIDDSMVGVTYTQAKKAIELFDREWIGQNSKFLWDYATKEAKTKC